MDLCQEADWGLEITVNVHEVQLKSHSAHQCVLSESSPSSQPRVYVRFPVKYSPALQGENKLASLENNSLENYVM